MCCYLCVYVVCLGVLVLLGFFVVVLDGGFLWGFCWFLFAVCVLQIGTTVPFNNFCEWSLLPEKEKNLHVNCLELRKNNSYPPTSGNYCMWKSPNPFTLVDLYGRNMHTKLLLSIVYGGSDIYKKEVWINFIKK